MDKFCGETSHRPLNGTEIRLVRLLPGRFDDNIVCELEHVILAEGHDYEAVSYAWGDPTDTMAISLDKLEYLITRSLYRGLQYLRHHDKSRILWIDSICINQRDRRERSSQIRRMRDIYKMATEVRIWLGDYEPFHPTQIHRYFSYLSRLENSADRQVDERHVDGHDLEGESFDVEFWWASMATKLLVYSKSWFKRAWVVQEVCVRAREGQVGSPVLVCGSAELALTKFLSFYRKLLNTPGLRPTYYQVLHQIPLQELDQMWVFYQGLCVDGVSVIGSISLAEQLALYSLSLSRFNTSDQHDRIYAILGLVVDSTLPHQLLPDYEMRVQEVFHSYAVYLLQNLNYLDIISCNTFKTEGMPSWVPDWGHVAPAIPIRSDILMKSHLKLLDGNQKIEVDGYFFTSVESVGPQPSFSPWTTDIERRSAAHQLLLDCERKFMSSSGFASKSSSEFRLAFTGFLARSYFSSSGACQCVMETAEPCSCHDETVINHLTTDFVIDATHRYAFLCDDGTFGLVNQPDIAPRQGDMIYLLHGSLLKVIVRPEGSEYRLVAQAMDTIAEIEEVRNGAQWTKFPPAIIDDLLTRFWMMNEAERIIIH